MEINLFQGQVGKDYEKMYKQLSDNDKLIVELYGLLAINKPGEKQDFEISQEFLIDKEINTLVTRYIIYVNLRISKSRWSLTDTWIYFFLL